MTKKQDTQTKNKNKRLAEPAKNTKTHKVGDKLILATHKNIKHKVKSLTKFFKQKLPAIILASVFLVGLVIVFAKRIGIKTSFINAKIEGVVYAHDSIRALPGIKLILNDGEQTVRTDSEGKFYFPNLNPGKHQIEVISDLHQSQTIKINAKIGKINKNDLLNITLEVKKFPPDQYLIITKSPGAWGDKTLAMIDLQGNELVTLGNGKNPKLKDQYTLQFDNGESNYEIFLDGSGYTRIGSINDEDNKNQDRTEHDSHYSSDNQYYFKSETILTTEPEQEIFTDDIFGSILFSWIPDSHKLIAQYYYYGDKDELYLINLDKNNEKTLITTLPNNSSFYLSGDEAMWAPDHSSFIEDYFLIDIQNKQAINMPRYSDYYYLTPSEILVSSNTVSEHEAGLYIFDTQGNQLKKIGDKKVNLEQIQFSSDKNKFIISDSSNLYIYNLEAGSSQTITDDKFYISSGIWLNY